MSDLFFRIAERALGLAPTVQPMVTPFFAPTQQQENSDLFFEVLPDEAQSDEEWQAGATTNQVNHGPEQPSQPQHVHIPERPSYPENAPVPVYPSLSHYTHKLEQPSYPHHAQHKYTPEHPHTTYSQPPSPGYPQGVPLQYALRLIDGKPGDEGRVRRPGVAHPKDDEAPITAPLATGSQRVGTPQTSTRTQTPSRQTERHTSETEPESRQVAPTVHDTIGRIEVRATPAPAMQVQAQRQQAAPKTMSLDEYLKQSGKGGGR